MGISLLAKLYTQLKILAKIAPACLRWLIRRF
jgi:hypothetical protein